MNGQTGERTKAWQGNGTKERAVGWTDEAHRIFSLCAQFPCVLAEHRKKATDPAEPNKPQPIPPATVSKMAAISTGRERAGLASRFAPQTPGGGQPKRRGDIINDALLGAGADAGEKSPKMNANRT